MKGIHCSWVDMLKIRQSLSNGRRGYQSAMEHMRCVDQTTVSTWKRTCDVLDAIDGKYDLSHVSTFQPTHAREIARHFRRKAKVWDEATKDQIADWVDRCEAEELTVEQLRHALLSEKNGVSANDTCTVDDLAKLKGRTFGTIYADPPWPYGNQATRASTNNHYETPSLEWIAALPIRELAAEQSHLHLWTTNGFLREAFGILDSWGFEYKSVFVWVKPQMGIGNYWRVSHEFLLLGVRGGLTFPANESDRRSWCELKRKKHSAKPDEIRLKIERVSPGPRLELFGREVVPGWTVWGNQIERRTFDGVVQEL